MGAPVVSQTTCGPRQGNEERRKDQASRCYQTETRKQSTRMKSAVLVHGRSIAPFFARPFLPAGLRMTAGSDRFWLFELRVF